MLGDDSQRSDHVVGTTASAGRRSAEILYFRDVSATVGATPETWAELVRAQPGDAYRASPDPEGFKTRILRR
jgi:hypothetical protein